MVTTKMSASLFALILVVLIQGNGEAYPVRDYDGVPSGVLKPISGVVPISVPRRRPDAANQILKAIRARVDKEHVSQLDSSVRDDIIQAALAPPECLDKYGIRDGVLKHTIRGLRDVVGAIVQDFQGLGQGILKDLPLVPHVINGISEAVIYVLCGLEDVGSDVISGFDEGPDIITKVLVDLVGFQGSAPLANIPAGVVNITELIGKVGAKILQDLVYNLEEGVEDLAMEVGEGVSEVVDDVVDVVKDVAGVVSGVETDVTNVVNAVDTALQMIGGGVGSGVSSIVNGIKGGLGGVVKAL